MALYAIALEDPTDKPFVRTYTRDYHVYHGHVTQLDRNRFGQLCLRPRHRATTWKTRGAAVNKKVQLQQFDAQRYGKAQVILVYQNDEEIRTAAERNALIMFDALHRIAIGKASFPHATVDNVAAAMCLCAHEALNATKIET